MGKLGLDTFDGPNVDVTSLKGLGRSQDAPPAPIAKAAARAAAPLIDTHFTAPAAESAERVVKDSFTFPPAEHALLEGLAAKALRSGRRLGKSAILRAGLKLLAGLDDADFAAAIAGIEEIRRGPRRR
jgi:hypothetical protein